MIARREFYPPRQAGTIVHLILILLFSSGGAWAVWQTSNSQVAPRILPYLALIGLSLAAVPFLIYRLYALHRSRYILERGGVILEWGWRSEVIPMDRIQWIYPADQLEPQPRPPWIRWPGSVLGSRGNLQEGKLVFLASRAKDLVVIAAGKRYYGISPPDSGQFLETYQQLTELGSIYILPAQTAHPVGFLSEISTQRPALWSFVIGGLLSISLLIWTLAVIPSRERISLGFSPQGTPYPPLESVRLILLPIINTTAYLANLILGFFLFRREENRLMAYLLWGSSILVGAVFHISMAFLTR